MFVCAGADMNVILEDVSALLSCVYLKHLVHYLNMIYCSSVILYIESM